MAKLSFSLTRILIDDSVGLSRFHPPVKSDFDIIQSSIRFEDSLTWYDVDVENNNDYFWAYFNYGNTTPRSTNVLNTITGELIENKREEYEAELLDQLFIMYNYSTCMFYISNVRKKKLIEDFFKSQTGLNIVLTSFYKSKEDMINEFKKVNSIKFTHINNLFNQESKQYKALVDLTGTGSPRSFKIEASYKGSDLRDFIRILMEAHSNSKLDSLIICGTDEHDIETIFNIDSIVKKWELNIIKDEHTGLYNANEIKQSLWNFINDER